MLLRRIGLREMIPWVCQPIDGCWSRTVWDMLDFAIENIHVSRLAYSESFIMFSLRSLYGIHADNLTRLPTMTS